MQVRRLTLTVAVLSALVATACSDDDPAVSLDGARQAAAQPKPSSCPLHLDASAALKSAGVGAAVTFASADAERSKSDKPADDPMAAQQGGMSAIDASAGVYLECDYRSDHGDLKVRVAVLPRKGALNLLLPQLVADAKLAVRAVEPIASAPPAPGDAKVFGNTVGVGGLAVSGGDGAIMVTSGLPDLTGDKIAAVTTALAGQAKD